MTEVCDRCGKQETYRLRDRTLIWTGRKHKAQRLILQRERCHRNIRSCSIKPSPAKGPLAPRRVMQRSLFSGRVSAGSSSVVRLATSSRTKNKKTGSRTTLTLQWGHFLLARTANRCFRQARQKVCPHSTSLCAAVISKFDGYLRNGSLTHMVLAFCTCIFRRYPDPGGVFRSSSSQYSPGQPLTGVSIRIFLLCCGFALLSWPKVAVQV